MAELSEKIEQLEKEKCDLINKVDCLESVVNEVIFCSIFLKIPRKNKNLARFSEVKKVNL